MNMLMLRQWAMPNSETFKIPPIAEFLMSYLVRSKISIDPFARNSNLATYTNDLNPETSAQYHMDAFDFMEWIRSEKIYPDLIILDPPYTHHQIVKKNQGYGDKKVNSLTPIYKMN